ncbi:hypothetical protein HDC90_002574 [Pedobacter sp. AK013]|nr:hypothetical protein [Pedobacter sp. AK013]
MISLKTPHAQAIACNDPPELTREGDMPMPLLAPFN